MNAWQEYLREVRGHLESLRAMGITDLVLPPPEELPAVPRDKAKVRSHVQPSSASAITPVERRGGEPARQSDRPPVPAPSHPKYNHAAPPVQPAPAGAPVTGGAKVAVDESLDAIQAELAGCQRCRLCEKRTNIVFGVGNPRARLMFVGEGPGEEEDLSGEPFVGKAGQLLTKIIAAMGLTRDEVYIANVVKCRPPGNRTPFLDEVEECYPFLRRQIAVIKPEIIVTLGLAASQALLEVTIPLARLRGNFYPYGETRVMPTYHPAYLLRNEGEKAKVWADMKKVMAELGLEVPQTKK